MILIIIKFGELLLWISPKIINALRSYIKYSSVSSKTRLRLFFQHTSQCLDIWFAPKVLFTLWYMLKRIRSNIGTAPSRIFGALLQYFHQYWQRHRPLWSLRGINSGRTGKILLLQEIKEIVTYLQKSSFHWFRQLNLLGVGTQSIHKTFSADTLSKVRPWSQESWGFQKMHLYLCSTKDGWYSLRGQSLSPRIMKFTFFD